MNTKDKCCKTAVERCPFSKGQTLELFPGGPKKKITDVRELDDVFERVTVDDVIVEVEGGWLCQWPTDPFGAGLKIVTPPPAEEWDDLESAGLKWDGQNRTWPDYEYNNIQIRTGYGQADSTLGVELNVIRKMLGLPERPVKESK